MTKTALADALSAAVEEDENLCGLIAETNASEFKLSSHEVTRAGIVEFKINGEQNPEKPKRGTVIHGRAKWDGIVLTILGAHREG